MSFADSAKSSYLNYPTVKPNVINKNGRCGHGMIPQYCAFCNPGVRKRMKQRKKPDRRRVTSRFIILIIDNEDGSELDRFWDDELDAAKAARDEVNELLGEDTCNCKIIDNPEHPDVKEAGKNG